MHKSDLSLGAMHQNEPANIRPNPLPIQDAAPQKQAISGNFLGLWPQSHRFIRNERAKTTPKGSLQTLEQAFLLIN